MSPIPSSSTNASGQSLLLTRSAGRLQRLGALAGRGLLFLITSCSAIAILFIFAFIIRDAWPFFSDLGLTWEFFTSAKYYPSAAEPSYGALAIFIGSGLVTLSAALLAAPLGVSAAVCLSDVLPFSVRQVVKPIIEILAAIPSVAYGFFALVVFAPMLQEYGGRVLSVITWALGAPVAFLAVIVVSDLMAALTGETWRRAARWGVALALGAAAFAALWTLAARFDQIEIPSGVNALNVSIILAIMALPTVVSVSEDALSAVGRDLREGSYALGATRAETVVKVILPAAGSGILAAILLGVMRAIGETMVVWMASGNAARIPSPWYNLLQPVRTLTATIAGDMGEADQMTGSERYHILFAMGLCLLSISFLCNLISEYAILRAKRKGA